MPKLTISRKRHNRKVYYLTVMRFYEFFVGNILETHRLFFLSLKQLNPIMRVVVGVVGRL